MRSYISRLLQTSLLCHLILCVGGQGTVFAAKPVQLSQAQILEDLAQLDELVTENHPNPFVHSSEHSYAEQLRLVELQFENGGTPTEFYAATAPIIAALQDVHTRLLPSNQGTHQLPFHLVNAPNQNYLPVSPIAIRALPQDGHLLEINGWRVSTMLSEILDGVSGAQMKYREAYLDAHLVDYLNRYTSWGPSVDLTFCIPVSSPLLDSATANNPLSCDYNGRDGYLEYINIPTLPIENTFIELPNRGLSVLDIQGLSFEPSAQKTGRELMVVSCVDPILQPADIIMEVNGTPIQFNDIEPLNGSNEEIELLILRNKTQITVHLSEMPFPPRSPFDYEPISPDVMRLNIWRFEDQEAFKVLLDEMFERMRKRGQGQLVIDLRESEGAHSALINTFYAYVADAPMSPYSYREVRRNLALKKERPGLHFVLPMIFPWKVEGQSNVYRIPFKPKPPFERSRRFRGDIIVLTSVDTLSTAASFAAVLSDYDRALLIGEETGGAACPTGGVLSFTLKHTQLEGQVSRFIYGRPSGICREGGVEPNRAVDPVDALDTAVDILYLKRAD
ncbi:MAG: S41 family peptidase [Myxococcota bacterium]